MYQKEWVWFNAKTNSVTVAALIAFDGIDYNGMLFFESYHGRCYLMGDL